MPQAALKGIIPATPVFITNRDVSCVDADMAAVKAIAQGAVNVEMFTLPLYLCAMSSIQGMHEINSGSTDFYKGRVWPGMATTAGDQLTPNQQAYNTVFSVFIQEMLHLQLAANLATVLGTTPKFFDGSVLENDNNGWACYGPDSTIIPHIIDLQDTLNAASVKVNLDELDSSQITLFMAIEQPHGLARANIKPDALDKYFPAVPFANWTAVDTEVDLPMFGTIGWMYHCLLNYLAIEYSDGKNLWEKMFDPSRICSQRDLFNAKSSSHAPEYPGMPASITTQDVSAALLQAVDIVTGICDQGEGGIGPTLKSFRQHLAARMQKARGLLTDNNVQPQFQPDGIALIVDYPSYDADGNLVAASADADARSTGDKTDHWERFASLNKLIAQPGFMTWKQWFASGRAWQASDLVMADYDPASASASIPSPQDVAAALNELKAASDKAGLSKVVVGAIAGINNVLTASWGDTDVKFPYPSMAGSGDRMSFYWAVFGEAPDLSAGVGKPSPNLLYHACQGLDYEKAGDNCASMEVYHTCRGSNSCKAQGGCGFVQSVNGGGSCSAMRVASPTLHAGNLCGSPSGNRCGSSCAPKPQHNICGTHSDPRYTAPNDNKCKSYGGCAVPISASQLYPSQGSMIVDDVIGGATRPLPDISFKKGDSVYDIAWQAYVQVMRSNGQDYGDQPKPNALRTALPPST